MVLLLIYQMFAKLLSWAVLHARSENAKKVEILVYTINWPCSNDARPGRRSAGLTAP